MVSLIRLCNCDTSGIYMGKSVGHQLSAQTTVLSGLGGGQTALRTMPAWSAMASKIAAWVDAAVRTLSTHNVCAWMGRMPRNFHHLATWTLNMSLSSFCRLCMVLQSLPMRSASSALPGVAGEYTVALGAGAYAHQLSDFGQ